MSDNNILYDRAKLMIVTSLASEGEPVGYMELQNATQLTKGNLTSHLAKLEAESFVKIKKQFVDKKPLTTIELTSKGRDALREHVDSLKAMIKKMKL